MSVLPDLPKQIKKREAGFGIKLRRWLEEHGGESCVFELKQTTTRSISFSCVKEKQIPWLLQAKGKKGILLKNPGGEGQPDYSYHRLSPAWVVIRYPQSFYVIDIDAFLYEKKTSDRKSLTQGRASQIATWAVAL